MSQNQSNSRCASVCLRNVEPADLPALCEHQLDPESNRMAVANPRDVEAFHAHWTKVINDPSVVAKAILADGEMVGYVSCFNIEEKKFVGYWIARPHWGRGIASRAMALLLEQVTTRPLHARIAKSNAASLRVLKKCGFQITGYEQTPATERYPACEEAILILK